MNLINLIERENKSPYIHFQAQNVKYLCVPASQNVKCLLLFLILHYNQFDIFEVLDSLTHKKSYLKTASCNLGTMCEKGAIGHTRFFQYLHKPTQIKAQTWHFRA